MFWRPASLLFEPPFPVGTNEIVDQLKAVDAHDGGVFTKLGLDAGLEQQWNGQWR